MRYGIIGRIVKAPGAPVGPVHCSGIDRDATDILQTTLEFTMTSQERIYQMVEAVRYIVRAGIPGPIVECSVWWGGSMMTAALSTGHDPALLHFEKGP